MQALALSTAKRPRGPPVVVAASKPPKLSKLQPGPSKFSKAASVSSKLNSRPAVHVAPASVQPVSNVLTVPCEFVMPGQRVISLLPCVIQDIDGFLYAFLRWRIERDVLASSAAASVCECFGFESWMHLGTCVGFYMCDFVDVARAVAMAASHQAVGVFIVPVQPGAAPLLAVAGAAPVSWFDLLMKHALMSFALPGEAVVGVSYRGGVLAVVASFDPIKLNFPVRFRRREDRKITLDVWQCSREKLGPVPVLRRRISPRAGQLLSSVDLEADTLPESPPFVVPASLVRPVPAKTGWNLDAVRKLSEGFPDQELRALALSVMDGSCQPFRGRLDKAVVHGDRKVAPSQVKALWELYEALVAKGTMWGPSSVCPFEFARPYPPGVAVKHKHDPASSKMRNTSDLSAGGAASVNELTWSPELLYVSTTARMLGDKLAWLFLRAKRERKQLFVEMGDFPGAFKMNPQHEKLLPLFVSMLPSAAGPSFFCDLAHVFGWIGAEWGWQVGLALVVYIVREFDSEWYVDNYWLFDIESDAARHRANYARFRRLLASLGCGIHEESEDPKAASFKGLGWLWETAFGGAEGPVVRRCCPVKRKFYEGLFDKWAEATSLPLDELESARGVLQFVAEAFPTCQAYVAPISSLIKAAGKRVTARLRLSKDARESFSFIRVLFKAWNGVCPVVLGFGPCGAPEAFGWHDASTSHGRVGGVLWIPKDKLLFCFSRKFLAKDVDMAKGPKGERSAPALEVLGQKVWLQLLGKRCARLRLLLHGDCAPAIQAFHRPFSSLPTIRIPLRDVRLLVASFHICLRCVRVPNTFPPLILADHLSRSNFEEAKCLALSEFGAQLLWV